VIAAFVIALALGAGQAALSPERHPRTADVRCDYVQRIECTAAGCQTADVAGGHLRLPPLAEMVDATARASSAAALPAIQVCDARGCTPIAVRAVRGGAFVNIAQDGGAHFVKVAVTDVPPGIHKGDFVEVTARFLTTATFVGSCPAIVP
jgi:hypothetical protein